MSSTDIITCPNARWKQGGLDAKIEICSVQPHQAVEFGWDRGNALKQIRYTDWQIYRQKQINFNIQVDGFTMTKINKVKQDSFTDHH